MRFFLAFLRRKRGIVLFVVAFMLPLFFVIAVSIDTITKRKKATYSLLESNLWLSARSALNQMESRFMDIEKEWMDTEYFDSLLADKSINQTHPGADIFIIDSDFNIVYPETLKNNNLRLLVYDKDWDPNYRKFMTRGEMNSQNSQNYSSAVKNYQKALSVAETKQQKGLAIEGMARTYLADKNYKPAIKYYQILKNEYSQTRNLSDHPYGITAPLQLYTIGKLLDKDVAGQDSLEITYRQLKGGNWLINPSAYFFFKGEYESIIRASKEPTISGFERKMKFSQFLDDFVIPYIKENSRFPEINNPDVPRRTYIPVIDGQYMISYREIRLMQDNKPYFGGIRWNMDFIISQIIPPVLKEMEKESGMEFLLVNNRNIDLYTGKIARIPEKSLKLSFENIPFPWILVGVQPGFEKLESDVKIQLIIYGILVVLILALMFFGVIVLLRDINRETESMLLKTEFVHNVSHELKTPLSLIRLYGETLLMKKHLSESERRDGLLIITKESERLSHMINNILDFSKIEMGRKEFNLKPGNLAELVKNTLNSYQYHFEKKGFKIKGEINEDIPEVMFDSDAVKGVLINLFSNVIKFSSSTKVIELRLKQIPGAIQLIVADRGVGIPADELPNIFNRFYRVKNSSDIDVRGSGLGLTLVKHVIDAHGWQIDVDSIQGQGTTFSITVPTNPEYKKVS